jgi:hypothetical protein
MPRCASVHSSRLTDGREHIPAEKPLKISTFGRETRRRVEALRLGTIASLRA